MIINRYYGGLKLLLQQLRFYVIILSQSLPTWTFHEHFPSFHELHICKRVGFQEQLVAIAD